MPKQRNPDTIPMPTVLTGREGEVSTVSHWPLSEAQARRRSYAGCVDVLLHFDKIVVGGEYNCRRVRYDGRFYVSWHRAPGGKVYIAGPLKWDVLALATELYD